MAKSPHLCNLKCNNALILIDCLTKTGETVVSSRHGTEIHDPLILQRGKAPRKVAASKAAKPSGILQLTERHEKLCWLPVDVSSPLILVAAVLVSSRCCRTNSSKNTSYKLSSQIFPGPDPNTNKGHFTRPGVPERRR